MNQEIENIALIIDRVRDRVWEDGYYLDYHRHSKSIARAIHESGYRKEADVVREILDEIEKFAAEECVLTGVNLYRLYEEIDAINNRYARGLNYQERVSTIRDVEDLYKRMCADPYIKQYRGYTASKSYGYDAETKKVIAKDGEFWFDNPSFRGGDNTERK